LERDLHINYHWAGGDLSRIQSYAKELVRQAPDVILANATPALAAIVQVIDPVRRGFVDSLARPGKNITGFTNFEFDMGGKWIELLKEISPLMTCAGVIFNPDTAPYGDSFIHQIRKRSSSLGIDVIEKRVRNVPEVAQAVDEISANENAGAIVLPDTFTTVHRDLLIGSGRSHHLTCVYPFRYFAAQGGLISYGVEAVDLFRRAAIYVSQILDGANPMELPVQAPTKFEMVLNLKTAKALELRISPALFARVDELIE
jgi:putative ABC transport system substrate-binding protein